MHLRKRADTVALPPLPTSVPPSGDFDGNDGKWSSFFVNINSDDQGVNGQDFKVLISTSSPLTLIPTKTEWCDKECAARRGNLLHNNVQNDGVEASDHWQPAGIYEIPLPKWYAEPRSSGNVSLSGRLGKTNVGIGRSSAESLVMSDRYAVQYIVEDFFMGSFGLAVGSVGPNLGAITTYLTQTEDDGFIASSSFGYTAGAWYSK